MQIFFWARLSKTMPSFIIFKPQINCLQMKKGSSELTLPHTIQSSRVISLEQSGSRSKPGVDALNISGFLNPKKLGNFKN